MIASFFQRLMEWTNRLALGSALAGGLVLLLLVLLTVLSILGRELAALSFLSDLVGPIPGDYELIELGMGFAIFAFLPWAHWTNGHASVDLLKPYFGRLLNRLAEIAHDLLMFIIAVLFMRQLWLGMLDKQSYDETSFILQIPLWWGYAAASAGAALFTLIALIKLIVTCFGTQADAPTETAEPDVPGGGI